MSIIPPPPSSPSSNPNLKTTLSTLKTLIKLSQTTLLSLPTTPTTTTIPCPFNHHHKIPPESLFSHSLQCQNPPFSLSPTTFFYQYCPSVVSLPPPTHHPFTLPHFLSSFTDHYDKNQMGLCKSSDFRFLPSEYMFVKRETDGWNDYCFQYSCIIRRVILCLGFSGNNVMDGISRWVIVNSPRYGLIIDASVRDHVVLLLRLCLRAIFSEAIGLGNGDLNEFNFKCPVLNQVLVWYGTQLSILYGEMNGKLFAIHLLKQLILNVIMKFLMFSDESVESRMGDLVSDGNISVSQVEDAVAAFCERSLLEEKIKAVRYSRQLDNSQRVAEHEYISKRAEEERHKRPDYKPIIEHDLFSWQRGRNQNTNVTKSKEELLAEERDYKRRRMSYRGKKIKRTTTQVMRDIIEEYTEEIKAAGGFGSLQHVTEESGKAASDSFPLCNTSEDNVIEKGLIKSSDGRSAPTYNRIQLHSYKETRSTKIDQSTKDLDQSKLYQKADRNRYDRKYYSKSPEKLRTNGSTSEKSSVRGQTEVRRESSRRSPARNYSSSREQSRHGQNRLDGTSEDKSRREESLGRRHKRDSVSHKKFQDRYNPSESWDTHEDNL